MPDKDAITYEYIREVLDGRKKLLKVADLKTLTVPPKVEGLRIAAMWEQVKADNVLSKYFPAFHGRTPPKQFFFTVGLP